MKHTARKLICAILTTIMMTQLVGCGGGRKAAATVDPIDDNYRVVYQIFVGSFSDADGDGTGDLQGIINRMDYLNDGDINSGKSLGVQCLWLSPIFSSPSYHKYDTTDFYGIDEKFGTTADLQNLLEICHARNVKVILDLTLNHTSSSHVWFQKFVNAHKSGNTADPYYDFYTWCTAETKTSGHAWTKISGTQNEYYECNFSTDMPELNYDCAAVYDAMLDVAKYYLDLGVDGFRFDAAKYIYYGDAARNVAFWQQYVGALETIKPDLYTVGEVWSADTEILQYTQALDCFDFQMAGAEGVISLAAQGKSGQINAYTKYVCSLQAQTAASRDGACLHPFIANHDMDRAAGYLTVSTGNAYMAANLLLLSPGSPTIYYGEEIGMKGTRGSASTDANRRLAMLWGDGDTVTNPTGSTFAASKQINGTVASQSADEGSLLNYYARVIALRNKYPGIARGTYTQITLNNKYVGGFAISYDNETIGLIHNTGNTEVTVDLSQYAGYTFTALADTVGLNTASLEGTLLTVGAKTSVVLR